jgi:hypothetical protein
MPHIEIMLFCQNHWLLGTIKARISVLKMDSNRFDSTDARLSSHTHTKVYLLHSERILQGGEVLDILLRAVATQRHSQQRRHAEKHCNTTKFLKNHGEEMVGRSRDIVLYIYAFLYSHTSHTLMGRSHHHGLQLSQKLACKIYTSDIPCRLFAENIISLT